MNMRLTVKMTCLLGLLAVTLVALPGSVRGQDLVKEALGGFPSQTIRLEFSSPPKLRSLPNYASLRQRYIGPRLRKLVDELGQLGIHEEDISGLVLGWQPGSTEMALYGFASGRFSAQAITESAQQRNMTPTPIAGKQAYCLEAGLAGTCVVVLQDSLGAFGSLTALTSILEAREGQNSKPGLRHPRCSFGGRREPGGADLGRGHGSCGGGLVSRLDAQPGEHQIGLGESIRRCQFPYLQCECR